MVGVGVLLDATVYHRRLPYQPGWLALPLGLLDTGLAMARRFAPAHLPDDAAIRALIASSRRGPLLDISDGGERVEIIIE